MPQAPFLDVLLRGIAVGGFAVTAIGLAMPAGPRARLTPVRWLGAGFFLAAIGHTLDNSAPFRGLPAVVVAPMHILSVTGSALFWAFALALFRDKDQVAWRRLWPAALILVLTQLCLLLNGPLHRIIFTGTTLLSAGLVAHALLVIGRGWGDDLVDSRRRLRAPVMASAAAYVLLIAWGDLMHPLGPGPLSGQAPQAAVLAVLAMMGAYALLSLDPSLLTPSAALTPAALAEPGAPAPIPGPDGGQAINAPFPLDMGDRLTLERLSRAMDVEEAWRRETLTVGALASLVGAPEHRLRRLINGALGQRNFAAYINARRIAAAKLELSAAESWRKPVSSIAYDLGFGSLGPFNRAFKDATGMTPSAWRQSRGEGQAPSEDYADSPIPHQAA